MEFSLETILRPPLPGEEFGEGQTRLNLKKTYLSILGLPTVDALDYRKLKFVDLGTIISVWLLSDQELYFLQTFTHNDAESPKHKLLLRDVLAQVLTMHNKRKSLSWIRNEVKIRFRLCNHLFKNQESADGADSAVETASEMIVGPYRYRAERVPNDLSEMRLRLSDILREIDRSFNALFQKAHGSDPVVADNLLMEDCEAFGAELSNLELVRIKDYGVGLVATKDLEPGSKLISLDESKLVNVYQALSSSFTNRICHSLYAVDGERAKNLRRSESYMWAVLLGGRTSHGENLIPPDSEAAKILKPFYAAYVPPDFFMEEQLLLILYVAWEAIKGSGSVLYYWLRNLQGYESCEVEGGNLLISKYRQDVAEFLGEESPIGPIVDSARHVEECIRAWYNWLGQYLAPVFKETLGKALTGKLTLERLLWACWICESREFESPIPVPVCFFNQLSSTNEKDWKSDPSLVASFAESDSLCAPELTVTSTSEVEEITTLPNLQYLSQQAFGGTSKQRKQIRIPVCLGWEIGAAGEEEPIMQLCDFTLSLKLLTLVPIVDFINHSDKAQCPHPGFHDLESRQVISSRQPAENDLLEPIVGTSFSNDWNEVSQMAHVENRKFVLHTQSSVKAFEQVFINYGPHDGWSFLRYYGFTSTEAENINVILTPDVRFQSGSKDFETRACMMKVFKVPEEHVLNSNGLFDVMLAACRIIATDNLREILNNSSEDVVRAFIYSSTDPQINIDALSLLLDILTQQQSYTYDCRKYAELCDYAVSPNPPPWYRIWGEQLFKLLNDRKEIVERIVARVHRQFERWVSSASEGSEDYNSENGL